jgi:hypothetical protein
VKAKQSLITSVSIILLRVTGRTDEHCDINMALTDLQLVDVSVWLSKYLFVPYFGYSFTNLRIYLTVTELRHTRIYVT